MTTYTSSVIDIPQVLAGSYSKLLIGGEWVSAASGRELDIVDPGTGEVVGVLADGDAADADAAVSAARDAFDDRRWSSIPGPERARILWRIADLIEEHHDELTILECVDQGQPRAYLSGMVSGAATCFRHYAGLANSIYGVTTDVAAGASAFHAYTRREPVGVAALITPWNAPLLMAAWKLAPMLAAGCTGVLKPAEETSLTALLLARLIQSAGVPAGVVNVLTGRGAVAGASLAAHPDVDKISFTGSTEIGKLLVRTAAGTLKRLTLELGGKSPALILADADPEEAIVGAAQAIFTNTGQTCSAGSRLIVHESVYDRVVEGVSRLAGEVRLGHSTDPDSEIGPLISARQLSRVNDYIATGVGDGARVVVGGKAVDRPGFFLEPTVLAEVPSDSAAVQEEIFGPVLIASRFSDLDEGIALANDTTYGLSSSIWTTDVSTAHSVARRLRAGRVGINAHSTGDYHLPSGGFKQSGWGREHGPDGLAPFLEEKSVFTKIAF